MPTFCPRSAYERSFEAFKIAVERLMESYGCILISLEERYTQYSLASEVLCKFICIGRGDNYQILTVDPLISGDKYGIIYREMSAKLDFWCGNNRVTKYIRKD